MPTYGGKAVALELPCPQFFSHRILMFGDIPMCDEAARWGAVCFQPVDLAL